MTWREALEDRRSEDGTADGWMDRMIRFANGLVTKQEDHSATPTADKKVGRIKAKQPSFLWEIGTGSVYCQGAFALFPSVPQQFFLHQI